MGSSILKGEIRCPIRKKKVAATPEEKIRVQLLHYLITEKKYPQALIIVEKELRELPHLSSLPNLPVIRRADIVCFMQGGVGELEPLLLIECKAEALTRTAEGQISGYNQFVKAPFLALVSPFEVKFQAANPSICLPPFEGFPTYTELKGALCRSKN